MFGFLKRKNKDEVKEKSSLDEALSVEEKKQQVNETLREELEKERKREKKRKEKEPNWGAVMILGLTMVIGLVFWAYGKVSTQGFASLKPSFEKEEERQPAPIKEKPTYTNQDGIIIFEK